MKAKERLSRMRKTNRFGERLWLAADRVPGSKFDREIRAAIHYSPKCFNEMDNRFRDFQHKMLLAIREGRSALFRELADAIDIYHSHEPYQSRIDKIRVAFLWCQGAAKSDSKLFDVKRVMSHLRATGFPVDENTPRLIRQVRDEFKTSMQGKAGRSSKGE
jgi:hypothetical protein